MNALLMNTIQSLLSLGITALIPFLVKFVLSKTSKENLVKYTQMATIAVLAVEQTMGGAPVEVKKMAAETRLSSMLKGAINPDQIDHLLESSVFLMKQNYKTAVAAIPEAPAVTPAGPAGPVG